MGVQMFVFANGGTPREHKRIAMNKKLFRKVKRRMLKRLSVIAVAGDKKTALQGAAYSVAKSHCQRMVAVLGERHKMWCFENQKGAKRKRISTRDIIAAV